MLLRTLNNLHGLTSSQDFIRKQAMFDVLPMTEGLRAATAWTRPRYALRDMSGPSEERAIYIDKTMYWPPSATITHSGLPNLRLLRLSK